MSLLNKYRPQKFKEVKGQDEIVTALVQSIKKGKLHNAYLFAGKYGTGKTTLARLVARAINCSNFKNDLCGECQASSFNNLDVIELDAASQRGIDNIRELAKNSSLIPFNSKYKVYIIDEAHQLTSQASNAFLKTLEEPSSRTKFIFCTTEPWKMLSTIRSRCLPFYLKTIRFTDIKDRLSTIVENEGIDLSDDRILFRIAENSNNTLRDAINLLEICLGKLTTNRLTLKDIESSLNLISEKDIYNLLNLLMNNKVSKFFEELNKVVSSGKRYEDILQTLKYQVKEILFVKRGFIKNINKYKLAQIKKLEYSNTQLFKLLGLLIKMEEKITGFTNPKDLSEYIFLKFMQK